MISDPVHNLSCGFFSESLTIHECTTCTPSHPMRTTPEGILYLVCDVSNAGKDIYKTSCFSG